MGETVSNKIARIGDREKAHLNHLGHDISIQAVREELEKVLNHPNFRASRRLKDFLRFVVEETVEGRGEELKEYTIAVEVFQRDDSFDPRSDNIVRVEAGRLRSRLANYYAEEGKHDPLRIEFEKGRYAPVFRTAAKPESEGATLGTPDLGPNKEISDPPLQVSLPLPKSGAPQGSRVFATFNRKLAAFILAGLMVTGSITAWLLWRYAQREAEMLSVVVVPFENRSGDKEDEFFSDGLTDEVIDSLSRIAGLSVVARGSAFELKDKPIDAREVGERYNVRSILEGTVRKYGNRLRITAQLVDSRSGFNLWSNSYDRDYGDALAVQREISQAIVNALGVKLTAKVQPVDQKDTKVDPEAYKNYLMGRHFWNNLVIPEETRLRESFNFYNRAIAKDPSFAPSYVALASWYAAQAGHVEQPSTDELIQKAQAAAMKALELDGTQGEAYISLGLTSAYKFDWQKAEEQFKRALELVPGSEYAHQRYSTFLVHVGRPTEAASHAKEAARLDPVMLTFRLGDALYHMREFDDAIEAFENVLYLYPDAGYSRAGLGLVYLQKGLYDKGLAELQRASATRGVGDLGYGYAISGDQEKARKILAEFLENLRDKRGMALDVARIYIGLGEKDKAFEWLSRAINERDFRLVLPTDPVYDSLRSDPRYSDLLKQMKLR